MIKIKICTLCTCITAFLQAQIVEISSVAEYEQEVKDPSKQVFVQFTASWCSPCRWVRNEEEQWNKRLFEKIKILRVDIQKLPELSRRHKISSVPHMNMVDKEGQILLTKVGTKAIVQLMSSYEDSLKKGENFSVTEFSDQAK